MLTPTQALSVMYFVHIWFALLSELVMIKELAIMMSTIIAAQLSERLVKVTIPDFYLPHKLPGISVSD